jgi:hypothetical protein
MLPQKMVGAVEQKSMIAVQKGRLAGTDQLQWRYIGGFPRCTAGSLKRKMVGAAKPPQPEPVKAKPAPDRPKLKRRPAAAREEHV